MTQPPVKTQKNAVHLKYGFQTKECLNSPTYEEVIAHIPEAAIIIFAKTSDYLLFPKNNTIAGLAAILAKPQIETQPELATLFQNLQNEAKENQAPYAHIMQITEAQAKEEIAHNAIMNANDYLLYAAKTIQERGYAKIMIMADWDNAPAYIDTLDYGDQVSLAVTRGFESDIETVLYMTHHIAQVYAASPIRHREAIRDYIRRIIQAFAEADEETKKTARIILPS
jgi:hypothetical protein